MTHPPDLLRRVRFNLRHQGQWHITPGHESADGLCHAQHNSSSLELVAPDLGRLMDELETWEIMSAPEDAPPTRPSVPVQYGPLPHMPQRLPGQAGRSAPRRPRPGRERTHGTDH